MNPYTLGDRMSIPCHDSGFANEPVIFRAGAKVESDSATVSCMKWKLLGAQLNSQNITGGHLANNQSINPHILR